MGLNLHNAVTLQYAQVVVTPNHEIIFTTTLETVFC